MVERTDRFLVLTSRAFDFPAEVPANVRYVGPQLEEPAWSAPWQPPWAAGDTRPLAVVGLSTTYQRQESLLDATVSALGTLPVRGLVTTGPVDGHASRVPANVHVCRYVPHTRVAVARAYSDLRVEHTGWAQRVHATCFHQGATALGEAGVVRGRRERLRSIVADQLSVAGLLQVNIALSIMADCAVFLACGAPRPSRQTLVTPRGIWLHNCRVSRGSVRSHGYGGPRACRALPG